MSLVDPVNGLYLCPKCMCDFASFNDRARHKKEWHDEGGIYKHREHELRPRIDESRAGASKPISREEALKKVPLVAFV